MKKRIAAHERILLRIVLWLFLFVLLAEGIQAFQRYDMCCDMYDIARKYLPDVQVEYVGRSKQADCTYFVIKSPKMDELSESDRQALYEETNLEHIKVVSYLSDGGE